MVGVPRTPSIWQAVVEAHERELMMQRERSMAIPRCPVCGGDRCEHRPNYPVHGLEGVWRAPPGRPVGVTPAELMARQLRLAQAMSSSLDQRSEIEDEIRAYAKKLLAQRAAVVKDARLWDQARALLVRAGCEVPRGGLDGFA